MPLTSERASDGEPVPPSEVHGGKDLGWKTPQREIPSSKLNVAIQGYGTAIRDVSRAPYEMSVIRNGVSLDLLTSLGRSRAWELKGDYYVFLARLQADDLFALCFMERYLAFILQQEETNLSQAVLYYLKKESVREHVAKLLAALSVRTKERGDRQRLGYGPKLEKEVDHFISLRGECERDLEVELKRVQSEIDKLESVKEDARANFRTV